nr:hypothetical protein [uncultured Pseudodesulfovibrio sp.]
MDINAIIAWMAQHWELVAIAILLIDKIVAMSPTKWDDLLWTSVKKVLTGAVGKKAVVIVPLLFTVAVMSACGTKDLSPQESFIKASYQTLAVAGTTYDNAMNAVGDYYRAGRISEDQKGKIRGIALKYYGAYHLAREALTSYADVVRAGGDDAAAYKLAADALADIWSKLDDLTNYARDLGIKIPEGM